MHDGEILTSNPQEPELRDAGIEIPVMEPVRKSFTLPAKGGGSSAIQVLWEPKDLFQFSYTNVAATKPLSL